MTRAFDVSQLDLGYAFLDACPEHVFADVVTLPLGELPDRVAGVRAWHDALMAGTVPAAGTWPGPPWDAPARAALHEMNLPKFCADNADLTDAVLSDIVASFAQREASFRADVAAALASLERAERLRRQEEQRRRGREAASLGERKRHRHRGRRQGSTNPHAERLRAAWGGRGMPSDAAGTADDDVRERSGEVTPLDLDAETRARLRAEAEHLAAAMNKPADEGLIATWAERARAWAELAEVFGDLGELLGCGFDLARGVLKHIGWTELLRLQALLKGLPELREVLRALGRLRDADQDVSVADALFAPVRRLEEVRREVPTPFVPAETRGITRSGDIARMLPVEAVNLGHPKLRMLWHARRAENALLTYRVQGMDLERVAVERDVMEGQEGPRPRPDRGPILAVIDTSGSMSGLPERVAKAIVLEAVRTARSEKRRCYLYAYSGPGDVLEHELDLGPDGIGRLLEFLGHSFGGGTDIGAMTTVVERLSQPSWQKADVLLVSDGAWYAGPHVTAGVIRAKENGTRFHGVQVGARGQSGMHALCDPVHEFHDWAAAGGWR